MLCSGGMKHLEKFLRKFFSSCLTNCAGFLEPSEQMFSSGEETAQSINRRQLFHTAGPTHRGLVLQDVVLRWLLPASPGC